MRGSRKHSVVGLVLAAAFLCFAQAAPAQTAVQQSGAAIVADHGGRTTDAVRVIVRLAPARASILSLGRPSALRGSVDAFQAAASMLNATSIRVLDAATGYVAFTTTVADVQQIAALPDVVELFEDAEVHATTDTNYAHEVGLDQLSFTGMGAMIAIIDSGVAANHPFFSGRVIEEACFLSGGGCPAASGPGSAAPCVNASDPGRCVHGTHVAGIAAGYNSTLRGTAPTAYIAAIRVLNPDTGSTSDILAGLGYVAQLAERHYVTAASLSLGTDKATAARFCANQNGGSIVADLRARGIMVTAASGNDSDHTADGVRWPACLTGVIAVGSANGTGPISDFTNLGTRLDVVAPGEGLRSSLPDGSYGDLSGTSMATPLVGGGITTLRSEMDWPLDAITAAIKGTPNKLVGADGNTYTFVDFAGAYARLRP